MHILTRLWLSHFSRVWLCATPETAAHQAPPSLGFSRQEHWSGLPFPSLMQESEKWKWSHIRLLATPCTAAHQAPMSMGFSRQEYWSGVPLPSPHIDTATTMIKKQNSTPDTTTSLLAEGNHHTDIYGCHFFVSLCTFTLVYTVY